MDRDYKRKSRGIIEEQIAAKLLGNIFLWRLELKMLEIFLSLDTNKYLWKPKRKS